MLGFGDLRCVGFTVGAEGFTILGPRDLWVGVWVEGLNTVKAQEILHPTTPEQKTPKTFTLNHTSQMPHTATLKPQRPVLPAYHPQCREA